MYFSCGFGTGSFLLRGGELCLIRAWAILGRYFFHLLLLSDLGQRLTARLGLSVLLGHCIQLLGVFTPKGLPESIKRPSFSNGGLDLLELVLW